MQEILLIDNFDSFTWNLVHYLEELNCNVKVVRNNEIPFDHFSSYDKIVLSPGPGLPEQAGDLMRVFDNVQKEQSILGVCLGMQAIAIHLEGSIRNKSKIHHGTEDAIDIFDHSTIFKGLPNSIIVGLYHSWEVNEDGDYNVDSRSASDNTIMAISNSVKKLYGVQFHPESVMTPDGLEILRNFVDL